ncbi:MAG: WGR domain-containing protein [Planctomycetota bacterium]|nr:WGR domain-containing protein [Planctomycetota bacterium]
MTNESTTLYFREGTSDKVYRAVLEEKNGGFVVNFAFGRRGSTMQTGTKTNAPIPFQKAKSIYDKLVREKTAKGYTAGPDGTPYAHSENEQRDTGLRCQLLNSITEAEAEKLLDDPGWWMQEKYDGRRALVKKDETGAVTGINRKGLAIGLPEPIVAQAKQIAGTFVIDGECVGDKLYAFDCLEREGIEVAGFPYSKRLEILMGFVHRGAMECAPTAAGPGDKRDLFQGAEGRQQGGCRLQARQRPIHSRQTGQRRDAGEVQVLLHRLIHCRQGQRRQTQRSPRSYG